MVVTFFGHKDTPDKVKPLIEQTVERLIEENGNITFLVGTHGSFDRMTQSVLAKVKKRYPNIDCQIVLAYIKTEADEYSQYELPTVVPENIELTPKRFAINFRNKYMVEQCDTVICYITHDWGGAYTFTEKARKKGKTIINLAEKLN